MSRRWPALVLVVALLVGGLLLTGDGGEDDAGRPTDPATLLPVAAPADALGSVWFCAGQTAGDGTMADGTVVVANVGDASAVGRIEVVSEAGTRAGRALEVPARTTRRVRVADVLEAEWASARVEVDGGTVVVEHEVVGPRGRDVAACQTTASERAYLPSGATTRDATMRLAIYNPYPDAATVDLAFATTDARRRTPSDFQGLPVAAQSMIVVDVTPVVTVVPVAAATVTTRRGRVVVERIQTYDGEGASTTEEEADAEAYRPDGLALTPAVSDPRPVWSFPAGVRSAVAHERVVVFNPGDEEAEVEVEVALEDPARNGTVGPFPLTVPAGEFASLALDEAGSVPEGLTHSLVVRSVDGVPVVAERWIDAAGEEASYVGVATSTGSPVAAPRWAFASGRRAADEERGRVVVTNPGDAEVTVAVTAVGDGQEVPVPGGRVTLAPGARHEVELDDLEGARLSLVVEASGPVVAERRLMAQGAAGADDEEGEQGRGASVAVGIPLPPGLRPLR
ncbi:MAG TPA: DUF5719 family protein [Acidimicrobiales bacterium]|nr:DUF5719 family protein [Acidimicrobiales bacterium]